MRLDTQSLEEYIDNTAVFTEDDFKADTSSEILTKELNFRLEDILMEV